MFLTRIVPLVWASLPILQEAELPTAERLYRQAYVAMNSADPDAAFVYLSCLVNLHPEADYSATAVVTLVEFDLIHGRDLAAIEKIMLWSDRVLDPTEKSAWVTDDQENRWRRLLVTAIDRLDQQQAEWLGNKLSGSSSSASATELMVIRELARRALQNQQLVQAMELFSWLGEKADSCERQLRDFAIPIYLLQSQPSEKSIQLARSRLDSNDQLDVSQRFQLHWSVAEVLSQRNELQSAAAELESISDWLRGLPESEMPETSAMDGSTGSTGLTGDTAGSSEGSSISKTQILLWQAAADLRLGELLAMIGQTDQAASLALHGLQSYPQFPGRAGFRFLLTRCYIADIEFEKATRQLQAVLSEPTQSAESRAKAHWMLGEIRLMQQRYDQAVEHYSAVLSVEGSLDWHARALFQIAKCHEAQSRPMLAITVYRDLVDQFPESDLSALAQERLSSLSIILR
jgi:TolA-binding protein